MPVAAELMRLWNDYMHEEYGDVDCDFVFVKLCLHCTLAFLRLSRGLSLFAVSC